MSFIETLNEQPKPGGRRCGSLGQLRAIFGVAVYGSVISSRRRGDSGDGPAFPGESAERKQALQASPGGGERQGGGGAGRATRTRATSPPHHIKVLLRDCFWPSCLVWWTYVYFPGAITMGSRCLARGLSSEEGGGARVAQEVLRVLSRPRREEVWELRMRGSNKVGSRSIASLQAVASLS